MKTYILLFSLFLTGFAYGQVQVKKSSISCGGGTGSIAGYHVAYSIGETAMSEKTSGTIHVSEGFIGPDLMNMVSVRNEKLRAMLHLYPNPSSDMLFVRSESQGVMKACIYDLSGKALMSETQGQGILKISVKSLPPGSYLVRVTVEGKSILYQIIKE